MTVITASIFQNSYTQTSIYVCIIFNSVMFVLKFWAEVKLWDNHRLISLSKGDLHDVSSSESRSGSGRLWRSRPSPGRTGDYSGWLLLYPLCCLKLTRLSPSGYRVMTYIIIRFTLRTAIHPRDCERRLKIATQEGPARIILLISEMAE